MSRSKKNINKPLDDKFYKKTLRPDRQQSYKLIAKYIKRTAYPSIKSVIDYGAGAGWFLHWLDYYDVKTVRGIEPCKDAASVRDVDVTIGDKTYRMTPKVAKNITRRSLKTKIVLNRKFDLAMCIEVAEHIDEKYAGLVVENITRHTDLLIFSAATPGQGGYGHINEQPFAYWSEKLSKVGFYCDHEKTAEFRDYLTQKNAKKWYCNNIAIFERV